jgi:hypothetical protein
MNQIDGKGTTGSFGQRNERNSQSQQRRINLRYQDSANQALATSRGDESSAYDQESQQQRQRISENQIESQSFPSIQYEKSCTKSKNPLVPDPEVQAPSSRPRVGRRERQRRSMPATGDRHRGDSITQGHANDLPRRQPEAEGKLQLYSQAPCGQKNGDLHVLAVGGKDAQTPGKRPLTRNSSTSQLQSKNSEVVISRQKRSRLDQRAHSRDEARRRGAGRKPNSRSASKKRRQRRPRVTYENKQENVISIDAPNRKAPEHSGSGISLQSGGPCDIPETFNLDLFDAKE